MPGTGGELSTSLVFYEKLSQLFYHTLVGKRIKPLKRMKRLEMMDGCVRILLIRGLIITHSIAEMQPRRNVFWGANAGLFNCIDMIKSTGERSR
jgi:hypothetical protein